MKALNDIRLPRVAEKGNFRARQSEQMNQLRLNQNFREISNAIAETEDEIAALPGKIIKQIGTPAATISAVDSDGIWSWRKWSDGQIEACATSLPAVKNCTTASGSLFYADLSVLFPADLFSELSSVSATPICADGVLAAVLIATTSGLTVRVFSAMSANVSVALCIFAIGK